PAAPVVLPRDRAARQDHRADEEAGRVAGRRGDPAPPPDRARRQGPLPLHGHLSLAEELGQGGAVVHEPAPAPRRLPARGDPLDRAAALLRRAPRGERRDGAAGVRVARQRDRNGDPLLRRAEGSAPPGPQSFVAAPTLRNPSRSPCTTSTTA